MLVLKWVSVPAYKWKDTYVFSSCDGASMSLHCHNLRCPKLVHIQSTHFLVITIQFLFNFFHKNVICVSAWHIAYTTSVCACIPKYGTLVPLLFTVEDSVIGLCSALCSIRFCMVLSGFLSPLPWQEQENWRFRHKFDLVYHGGVCLTFIILNLTSNRNLSSDLGHSSTFLDHPNVGSSLGA